MPVTSVELFESPHQGGAGYEILASIPIPIPFHGSTFSHQQIKFLLILLTKVWVFHLTLV